MKMKIEFTMTHEVALTCIHNFEHNRWYCFHHKLIGFIWQKQLRHKNALYFVLNISEINTNNSK